MDELRWTICAGFWKELAWKIRRQAATTLRCTNEMAKGEKRLAVSGKRVSGHAKPEVAGTKAKRAKKPTASARAKAKVSDVEAFEPTNGSEPGATSLVIVESPAK